MNRGSVPAGLVCSASIALLIVACDTPTTGQWTGHLEGFTLDDGTDKLVITLDSATSSSVTGHVTFGDRQPYPPPTDPDSGYPEGYNPYGLDAHHGPLLTGFTFTIVEGSFDGERLQFSIETIEPWRDWCAMQEPIPALEDQRYSCIPHYWTQFGDTCSLINPMTEEVIPIDCGKLDLCTETCTCDGAGCRAHGGETLRFDIVIEEGDANGTAEGLDNDGVNVHLTRE